MHNIFTVICKKRIMCRDFLMYFLNRSFIVFVIGIDMIEKICRFKYRIREFFLCIVIRVFNRKQRYMEKAEKCRTQISIIHWGYSSISLHLVKIYAPFIWLGKFLLFSRYFYWISLIFFFLKHYSISDFIN